MFEVKNIDSPILWIRVDPDMEYIRKVKVNQSKENWLFQLLQEKDYMAKIEACKALSSYNEEFVYEILKSVAKNEQLFIKVRKQALKSLDKIRASVFSQFLSHEKSFLVNYFNKRNFNDKIGFYKSNNFKNITEYYMNTYVLGSLANSREHKLPVREDLQSLRQSDLQAMINTFKDADTVMQHSKYVSYNLKQHFLAENEKRNPSEVLLGKVKGGDFDQREFSVTTELISNLFVRLLKENDNSENAFDDCFYISKIIKNLGKLDNFKTMPQVAKEMTR